MCQGVTIYGHVVQTALFLLVYSRNKCRQIKYIVILSKEDFVVIVIYAPINNIKIKKTIVTISKFLWTIYVHIGFFYQYCPYKQVVVTELFNISVFINLHVCIYYQHTCYVQHVYMISILGVFRRGGGPSPQLTSCTAFFTTR